MATADKPLDPKALEVKYTYKDAAKDDAAIQKVETAIAAHFPAAYVSGLADKASDAPINKEEYEEQTKEAREKAAEEAKNNPKDVAKEAKDSPPGRVDAGAAHTPSVVTPKPPTSGPKAPQKAGGGAAAPKAPGKAAKPAMPGPDAALKPPRELVLAAAMSGDGNLDGWLNAYPHKSTETNERLSKIKEMAAIAQGYDGQIEKYVQNGASGMEAAKGGLINFLGKKDVGAIFGANPYDKVQGGLGSIMRGLSKFQSVVSIVGNVCGKIGMVLTIVGLLAMILPPLGAAVEAVARVLNVIGIICDAIGFVLSGILTGLNGVVLAKQIGKGASNEEKAATADMMMNEATSAGGHVLSLAMTYGPGFMKGFQGASKGVIGKLFTGVKNKIGTFAAKALGPVANWAKNIGYKLGIGLEKAEGPGMMSKLWSAPATLGEKIRGTKLITKINNSDFMKGVEARATKVSQNSFVKGVDGFGEKMGENAAGRVEKVSFSAKHTEQIDKFADNSKKELDAALESNAGKNAGNQERARIDRDISSSREYQNNQIADHRDEDGHVPKENVRNARAAGKHADKLEKGEEKAVAGAQEEGGKDFTKERGEKKVETEAEEATTKKNIEDFRKDPKKFQEETDVIEGEREIVANRLKDKNITQDQRKVAEDEAKKLRHEADQRHLIAIKANGGELPETMWHIKGKTMEVIAAAQFQSESGERAEAANKQIEAQQGGHAEAETLEKSEQREAIYAWSWGEVPEIAVYEHVESMLDGLDEGADEHGDEGHDAQDGGDQGHDAQDGGDQGHDAQHSHGNDEPTMSVDPASTSSNDSGAPPSANASPAPAPSPAPSPAPKPAPAAGSAPEDKLAEVPELVYWPKLSGADGEFAKAAKDLQRMKLVAYAFQKSQQEAKHKALLTVATMAQAGDDASLKQAQAMDHSIGINGTIAEATAAGASAQKGDQQAGAGEKKQDDGKANSASKNQPKVDVGEKPSHWHPIKRIWWYVKTWAAEKAAKVFGWIQDKIASLVLEGLCGVSMGDMRAYTTALHNRMQFSKLVGTQGQDKAKQTMDTAMSVKAQSKSYADQALDDARQCDQNVHDAATFVKDVEDTEKDIAKQQDMARTFLAGLAVAVAAEKANKMKAQADAATQKGPVAAVAPPPAPIAAATPALSAGPKKGKAKAKAKDKPKEPKISAAAVGKVHNAASYVSSQASTVVQRLVASQTAQTNKLNSTFENKRSAKKVLAQLRTGDEVVAAVREHAAKVTSDMSGVNSMSPANTQVLMSSAGKVKSDARELDELAHSANEQLNWAFKMTYDKVAQTRNLPWS